MKRIVYLMGTGKEGILCNHLLIKLKEMGETPDIVCVTGTGTLGVVAHYFSLEERKLVKEYWKYRDKAIVIPHAFSYLDEYSEPKDTIIYSLYNLDLQRPRFFSHSFKNKKGEGRRDTFQLSEVMKGCMGLRGVPFLYQLNQERMVGQLNSIPQENIDIDYKTMYFSFLGEKEVGIIPPYTMDIMEYDVEISLSFTGRETLENQKKILDRVLKKREYYIRGK